MNDYLDRLEQQLAELTERGAHQRLRARRPGFARRGAGGPAGGPRPPRRPSEAVALLAAVAVVIAVAAIVLVNVHSGAKPQRSSAAAGHTSTPTTTKTQQGHATTAPHVVPAPGSIGIPIPRNFYPVSFTAISELTWWVLGPAPCTFAGETPPCGELLRTTDGGRTFIGVQAPHASLVSSGGQTSGYSQIRFADMKNGFAYGPDLYATHDAGATWAQVSLGGPVSDLEISAGEAYAIVTTGTGNSGRLIRSPVSQDQWTPVPAAGEVSGGLWVLGHEVLVQSGSDGPGTDLLVSQDGGGGFSRQPVPSPGLPCRFEAQSPQVVWAHCVTGTESGVWHTNDYITGFKRVPGAGLAPLPNSAVFAAASDTTAVVGYQQLYRTGDGGATWAPVGPAGIAEWTYLGFTDATHGVGIGYLGSVAPGNQRLFYTTDGGVSYHLVPLP